MYSKINTKDFFFTFVGKSNKYVKKYSPVVNK